MDHIPDCLHLLVYNRNSKSLIVTKEFSPDVLMVNLADANNDGCHSVELGTVFQLLQSDLSDGEDQIVGVRSCIKEVFGCAALLIEKMPACIIEIGCTGSKQFFYYVEIDTPGIDWTETTSESGTQPDTTSDKVTDATSDKVTDTTSDKVCGSENKTQTDATSDKVCGSENKTQTDTTSDKVCGRLDKIMYSLSELESEGIEGLVSDEAVYKSPAVVMGLMWWVTRSHSV